ncbi:hypothetical protein VPMS16_2538 [Vibrio sp. 16]|nr:hypothetical protein VPMS16_2538 [Vibrio sp. 16]
MGKKVIKTAQLNPMNTVLGSILAARRIEYATIRPNLSE